MAHISSIGAAMFTDLSVAYTSNTGGVATAALPATYDKAGFDALFPAPTTGICKWLRLRNIRDFPAFGAQPNLVKVPVYGQKVTSTIGAQSDAPDFSVTINYVPSEWAKGTTPTTWGATTAVQSTPMGSEFANMVGDGVSRAWRIALLASDPAVAVPGTATTSPYASLAGGLGGTGVTPNSYFYFMGKLESILITPSLTDAVQATLAFSIQSDIYGAYTV